MTNPDRIERGQDQPAAEASAQGETPPRGSSIDAFAETPPQGMPAAGLPFDRLGHFQILQHIGRGGMGDVYKGYEASLDRYVAIKVLPATLARDEDFIRRFQAEATAVARLSNPHVVSIYFIGEDAGHHFFAMQFIEGESLGQRLARNRRLPVDEATAIIRQCLAGLEAAHAHGLIHRDVKPGNVLLDCRSGRAVLVDFGLVRQIGVTGQPMTATGVVLGTVDYIAPEQARGQAVDGRSDIYALGVMFYQLLSGRLPFKGDTPTALLFQHAYEEPLPLAQAADEIPQPVADVVARMMAKLPGDRYPNCAAVLADLRAVQEGRPIAAVQGEGVSADMPLEDIPLPYLPADTPWQRAKDWAATMFRRHAPEALHNLQSTSLQVDGAVAAYERRCKRLEDMAGELGSVLAELKTQIEANEQAAEAAKTEDGDSLREKEQEIREDLAALRNQYAAHQERSLELDLELSKAIASLTRLRSQRDLLRARLESAQARSQKGVRPLAARLGTALTIAIAAVITFAGASAFMRFMVMRAESHLAWREALQESASREPSQSPPEAAQVTPLAAPAPKPEEPKVEEEQIVTLRAIDEMDLAFEQNVIKKKAAALAKLASWAGESVGHKAIAGRAVMFAEEAVAKEDFGTAEQLAELAVQEAKLANLDGLVVLAGRCGMRIKEIRQAREKALGELPFYNKSRSPAAATRAWVDLLSTIDLPDSPAGGPWRRTADGIVLEKGPGSSQLRTAPIESSGYDVEMTFVRNDGDDIIGLTLPVGVSHTMLVLTASQRENHNVSGLDFVDAKPPRTNNTGFPADLQMGKLRTVRVCVRHAPKGWLIMASLDGKPVVYWHGAEQCVGTRTNWKNNSSFDFSYWDFALAGLDVGVTFKSLRMRAAEYRPLGPLPPLAAPFRPNVPTDAVLHLTFDSGTLDQRGSVPRVQDVSGHGGHAELSGAVVTPGPFGSVLELPETGMAYVAGKFPTGASPRTMAAWIRCDHWPNGNKPPYVMNYGGRKDGRLFGIRVGKDGWGMSGFKCDYDTKTRTDGGWHHHAVTYDGTQVAYYLDGRLLGTKDMQLDTDATPLRLGVFDANYPDFQGAIHDLYIYPRALTLEEIHTLLE
jgi:predicted Ser/Thr protein kinase